MKINILIIFSFAFNTFLFAQQNQRLILGEKILTKNIEIANDSIQKMFFVLEDGLCYRIETKFYKTKKNDTDIKFLQNLVKKDSKWDYDSYNEDDNFNDYGMYSSQSYYGGDYVCSYNDEKTKFIISYSPDSYEYSNGGLILIEVKSKLMDVIGIENKFYQKPKETLSFKTFDDPILIKEQKDFLNNLNKPINEIELPYKFNFYMTKTQILSHFKTILNKNSILKEFNFGSQEDLKLGIEKISYDVKTNGANSFSVEITYLNSKAVAFNYHHDYEQDKQLREKISALLSKYKQLATTFGNEIHIINSIEKIKILKNNYKNRGKLENKM